MDNQTYTDFLTVVGESFCKSFAGEPGFEDICPHHFQEALKKAIGPLTPELLYVATTEGNLKKIIDEFQRRFETDSVSEDTIVQSLRNSLARWTFGKRQ